MRVLHHPTPSPVANLAFECLQLFISRSNMLGILKFPAQVPGFVVVVAFIQSQVPWVFFCLLWPHDRNTFQRDALHLEIIAVGFFDCKSERESMALD